MKASLFSRRRLKIVFYNGIFGSKPDLTHVEAEPDVTFSSGSSHYFGADAVIFHVPDLCARRLRLANQAMLTENLGKPLSRIPDPFEKFESFAAHNNAMLRDFLDRFGFEYEFISSASQYEAGVFDDALKGVLRHYDAIMGVMLPTLRKERAATYSPILPISPKTGIVLQVPVEVVNVEQGTIRFTDSDGEVLVQSVLGGQAKLQWKVDWVPPQFGCAG